MFKLRHNLQVRSKSQPAGFDPNDPFTAFHNMLARRTAFILTIVLLTGHYVSVEQPGGSRLFLLHCFRFMVSLGCVISHFCFCAFGSPFQKPSKWLHNKPSLGFFLLNVDAVANTKDGASSYRVDSLLPASPISRSGASLLPLLFMDAHRWRARLWQVTLRHTRSNL